MRIIVSGGGTGGHVFPALEIAKALKRQHQAIEVIYVGNINSLEERMAKASGLPFFGLATKKMLNQSLKNKLIALFYLKIALVRSLIFLIKNRPVAVIGVGGYVSFPMVLASFFLRIRRYICEQNVVPGLANRTLAYFSHKVFISFKESLEFFKIGKTVYTGNPVRDAFFSLPVKEKANQFRILVTGGSLGAQFLNREIPQVFQILHKDIKNLAITHQTGNAMQKEVQALYHASRINAHVLPFIDDMPKAFFEHNLLISRAGATVLAEIMAAGMPAILIPYPHALGHQRQNALALAHAGGAIMVLEDANCKDHLAQAIKSLYSDQSKLCDMGEKAKSKATPKAALVIARIVLNEVEVGK